MKKVYVVGTAKHYADFITNIKHVDNIEEADIVIFTGGEDVDPSLYHEEKHPTTYSNIARDKYEKEMFEKIAAQVKKEPVEYSLAVKHNSAAYRSVQEPPMRKVFF